MTERAMSLPFGFGSFGEVNYTEDPRKIWQDRVVAVVMTKLNERVMRPTYGSGVPGVVFENISETESLIKQHVAVAFTRWLKDLTLTNVFVSVDPSDNYVIADIFYRYTPQDVEDSVKVKTAILDRTGATILEVTNGY